MLPEHQVHASTLVFISFDIYIVFVMLRTRRSLPLVYVCLEGRAYDLLPHSIGLVGAVLYLVMDRQWKYVRKY